MLSGAAVAQAVPLAGSLVIARLVSPADFGLFAAWLGVASVAAVLITGRYEHALPLEADGAPRRDAAAAILGLVAAGAVAIGVVGAVVVALAPAWLRGMTPWLVALLPLSAGAIAAAQVWQSWAAAEGRYRDLSIMRVAQALAVTLGQIVLAFAASGPLPLAVAHVAGVLFALVVSVRLLPTRPWPDRPSMAAFFRRHRRFPQWSLPADAINTAAGQLPVVLVASRFGAEFAGLLALTLRTLGAPIGLLGSAVLDVFKRRAAVAFRERGECRAEYLDTLRVLAIGSTCAALLFALAAEPLFALAFGPTWQRAGTIALWLLPLFALRFVASPLSYMVYIAGKQPVDLAWQCVLAVMTLGTLLLLAPAERALQGYGAGYSALYVVYLILSYRFSLGERRG